MSAEAFHAQHQLEQQVRFRHALTGRDETEHADFVLRHRHLFRPDVVEGAAVVALECKLSPSRWTHINADQPSKTALFRCSICDVLLKWPAGRCTGRRCTDLRAHYGHDPLGPRHG